MSNRIHLSWSLDRCFSQANRRKDAGGLWLTIMVFRRVSAPLKTCFDLAGVKLQTGVILISLTFQRNASNRHNLMYRVMVWG
jgi:hypothetical protein